MSFRPAERRAKRGSVYWKHEKLDCFVGRCDGDADISSCSLRKRREMTAIVVFDEGAAARRDAPAAVMWVLKTRLERGDISRNGGMEATRRALFVLDPTGNWCA